jgi:hypothetical protein
MAGLMTPHFPSHGFAMPWEVGFLKSRQFVMKSLQPAWASFDKHDSMKIHFCKNPVCFPQKMRGAFCYKRTRENLRERGKAPGRQVVAISSPPGGRDSGKNGGKILFQNETRALKSHEKMSGKM